MLPPRIAYLYSRWPVVSQTFCDSEMLAHEAAGWPLVAASLYPPRDSFRHERLAALKAPVLYPPPPPVLKALQRRAEADGSWPAAMVARHLESYGPSFQPDVRARNALWLARRLPSLGVRHVHVHFANRATHTALFLKQITGLPFSFTPHAQDFMVDLGSDDLLEEMCREAEFVIAVSDHSLALLQTKFPRCASRMRRVYNGLDPAGFPSARPGQGASFRIVSTGRLIEFKGFHHLIEAVARLRASGCPACLRLIGDGPWRPRLEELSSALGLTENVIFLGGRYKEDVKAELADADVFALACTVDGKGASDILPTVITEAMACGLPVVSTRLAGVPELVVDGATGLLAEPGDVQGLADHLQRLHRDPALANRLGAAGRQRAAGVFSLSVTSASLRESFASLPHLSDTKPVPPAPALWYLLPSWPDEDPSLRGEAAWVAAKSGSVRLLACACPEKPDPSLLGPEVDYLPDGIVLESEWQSSPALRAALEAVRHDLGSAIDGEFFFRCARRATWIAAESRKLGIKLLHAARSHESVVAWLASRIGGPAFTVSFEEGHGLDERLAERIRSTAAKMAEASGEDPLLLARPKESKRRLGPIKLRSTTPAPDDTTRHAALDRFFAPWLSC